MKGSDASEEERVVIYEEEIKAQKHTVKGVNCVTEPGDCAPRFLVEDFGNYYHG